MELPANQVPVWLEQASDGRTQPDRARIADATEFAIQAHQGQKRASGEDYVNHTFAVAGIVHELGLDTESVIAALLHDTVEDTDVTLDEIDTKFGEGVARLVDGVTKMEVIQEFVDSPSGKSSQDIKAESMRKMMLAMVDDVRVVLIKLCDRLHNMRTLGAVRPEKQKRIAAETLEIFSPLANRLGVWQIKWELEDLAFRYLEPQRYHSIAKMLSERRVDRQNYIEDFIFDLQAELKRNAVDAKVNGRVKHIYSIWSKMRRKGLEFDQLFDVRAVRVLVETVQDCYGALGAIHTKWKYIKGEFDDYIATPKENNYRSIHTAVIGPAGKVIEVQIRTAEMHEYNELGIAAHWRYKEGTSHSDAEAVNNKILWLRQLLEWKDEVADANEFIDRVKDEVFEDRVYVFSPKGKVVDLSVGCTPIDFAYAIHTEVGHRCRGARVNGKMVPLTHQLKTGEQVDIMTAKEGGPSLDWLNPHRGYVNSRRARSRIQYWFRHENRDETITHGRRVLERELDRMNLNDVNLEQLSKALNVDDTDEMYFKIADGSIKPGRAAVVAQSLLSPEEQYKDEQLELRLKGGKSTQEEVQPRNLSIQGVSGLMTQLAKCCQPVPGDRVLGFVTRGSGITIHRESCPNIMYQQDTSSDRVVEVSWGNKNEQVYPMTILITAFDRKGLLRDVSTVMADEKINVMELTTRTDKQNQTVLMDSVVEVTSLEALSRLMAKLDQLPNVLSVKRKN